MAKQTEQLSLKYQKKRLMQLVISTITEEDSVVTAQTTEAIEETTPEAIIEVARITKCLLKTIPKATNPTTEEATTPKEEEDKTEEVEEEIILKEEAKILPSCKEYFVNSVAKKVTGKISATQKLIVKNAKIKNCTQSLKKAKMRKNHNMTKMTTTRPMRMSPASSKPSQQKTKKWFP